jgi:hypothetical protein
MKIFTKVLLLLFLLSEVTFADVGKVKGKLFGSLENFMNENFENTDFKIKATESNNDNPEISIQTLQPIFDRNNELTFFQGSFFMHDEDRETLNLGIGTRILTEDENFILGFNTFYDNEFDYGHKRFGWGTEIKSSILELNTNTYYAHSGTNIGKNNVEETALDGYDIEIGSHAPFIPSLRFYTKFLRFDVPNGQDIQGLEYKSEFAVPNTGFILEVGRTDFSKIEGEWFYGIKYSLNKNKNKPREKFIKNKAYENISMKSRMYERVRRENIIVKDTSFKVQAGGF